MNGFVASSCETMGAALGTVIELRSADLFWPGLDRSLYGRRWTLVASRNGHRRWAALATAAGGRGAHRKLIADPGGTECHGDVTGVLVAFGGGAVIDFAKVTAYEMGRQADEFRAPPIIAIPTVAGSGSERTQFASVWGPDGKSSVEHPDLRPEAVFLVPEFALSVPYNVAATSALDALSHALEAIWNRNATPSSDKFAASAIPVLVQGLTGLAKGQADRSTIGLLMTGSSWAGEAIALTKTALAHSMSYPLTAQLGVPHGLATSFALAEIARFNLKEASRLDVIARAFGCDREQLPDMIAALLRTVGVGSSLAVPSLADLDSIALPMTASSRAANSIRPATEPEARAIARRAAASLQC